MKRISSQLPTYDSQYWLRLREYDLNEATNKMAAQTRIQNLRDDPLAAGRAVRLQSEIARDTRYQTNAATAKESYDTAEGYLRNAMDILQRIRELGVQGANGTFDQTQTGYMGEEVNELLTELVSIANAKDQNGNYLFAGLASNQEPFRATPGRVPGGAGDVVVSVNYLGDGGSNSVEVGEGQTAAVNLPGNVAFWAEQEQIYSTVDASHYRVQAASTISVDGTQIALSTGDTVDAVISKINDSNAPVRARLDPVANSLVLESTMPHQIQLEDAEGTVLQDLGILAPGTQKPPSNIAKSAQVFGGSIFDAVMQIRDGLFSGSQDQVASIGLRGIEASISSLSGTLAALGAKDNRVDTVAKRLEYQTPQLVSFESQQTDLDISQAATELKALEYGHDAALAASSRVLSHTLLDFLR